MQTNVCEFLQFLFFQILKMTGEKTSDSQMKKIANTLSAGVGIPGVFSASASKSDEHLSEAETEDFFEKTESFQSVTGSMPKFEGNRVVSSERSSQPGPLKIELGRICDLFDDVDRSHVGHETVKSACQNIFNGDDLCFFMLKRLRFLKTNAEKSVLVQNIADWPSCKFLGTMVFNFKPDANYQEGGHTFVSCVKQCRGAGAPSAFLYNTDKCTCSTSLYLDQYVECSPVEGPCQGVMFNSDEMRTFATMRKLVTSHGGYVVGDVLDVQDFGYSLSESEERRANWTTMISASSMFFEQDVTPSTEVKRTIGLFVNNILDFGKERCQVFCRLNHKCEAFQTKLMYDWFAAKETDISFDEVNVECVMYGSRGLNYIVADYSPLKSLANWIRYIPQAKVFDLWWKMHV